MGRGWVLALKSGGGGDGWQCKQSAACTRLSHPRRVKAKAEFSFFLFQHGSERAGRGSAWLLRAPDRKYGVGQHGQLLVTLSSQEQGQRVAAREDLQGRRGEGREEGDGVR